VRLLRWVAVIAVAGVLTGCGSSGSASTVTVTGATNGQTATESTTVTATPKQQLVAYLAAMKPLQSTYDRLRRAALHALDGVNTSAVDQSWTAAGKTLRRLRSQMDTLAARTTNTPPPTTLASAHHKLTASFVGLSQLYDQFASTLIERNEAQFLQDANDHTVSDRVLAERSAWRIAVTAAALRLGVPVPAWVRKVGTTA
jgi:hypothetical protein